MMASTTPTTASTTPTTPTTAAAPPARTRPSLVIQDGADRIVELLENEKAILAGLYHTALKGLEASLKKSQENASVKIMSIERNIEKQDKKIKELQTDLHRTRQYALNVTSELDRLRTEHEALKASLSGVGLVSVDGRLQFNDDVSSVVDEFVRGARMQQNALSSRLSTASGMTSTPDDDDLLSGPVGPLEFFNMLSGVMEKGRQFAASLGKHRQHEGEFVERRLAPHNLNQEPADMEGVISQIMSSDNSDLRKIAQTIISNSINIIPPDRQSLTVIPARPP